MPYVYAPGLGGLNLAFHLLPGYSLSALSSTTHSVSKSSPGDTQALPSGMTLKLGPHKTGEEPICSLQASLASLGALPVTERESKINGGYGQGSQSVFARWDQVSSSWKTCLESLGVESAMFLGRFPKWGTMRRGECFPASPWVPLNAEIAFSSWPTPTTKSTRGTYANGKPCLDGQAKMWQTPRAHESGGWQCSRGHSTPTLAGQITQYGPQAPPTTGNTSRPHSGRLNPVFVEWLQGYPAGWSDPNESPDYEPWETACHHLSQQWLGLSCQEGCGYEHNN